VTLAEVISTIQAVPGVEYVDVDKLDRISETITPEELETLAGRLGLQKRIVANLVEVTTRHDVQPGDTWESVAELYGINVQTLWRWNDLDLETLRDLYQPGDPAYPAIPPSVTTLAIPRTFRPAQLAYLVPTLPETLILNEIPS
jgi:hypothetical protein